MDIYLSENLRKLRKERGNTQDDLADFLGISPQAVSKWERAEGFPDITLLPRIAGYYDVSVYTLLGCDEIKKQERLEAFEKEMQALSNQGRWREYLALSRSMAQEYPNDLLVLEYLANTLTSEDLHTGQWNHTEQPTEIGETLRGSGDPNYDFESIVHTSPLVRGYAYCDAQAGRNCSAGLELLLREEMDRREFDPIRENPRFQSVGKRLALLKKKYPADEFPQ